MEVYLYINAAGRVTGWSTTRSSTNDIKMDVPKDHEVLINPLVYIYNAGQLTRNTENALAEAKKRKEAELDASCRNSIMSGFTEDVGGVMYHFSFDIEAQFNFNGASSILDKGIVPALNWTVKRDGGFQRIVITKAIMDRLLITIIKHKDSHVKKFRELLLPIVLNAKSVEEVNAVHWNMTL